MRQYERMRAPYRTIPGGPTAPIDIRFRTTSDGSMYQCEVIGDPVERSRALAIVQIAHEFCGGDLDAMYELLQGKVMDELSFRFNIRDYISAMAAN